MITAELTIVICGFTAFGLYMGRRIDLRRKLDKMYRK